MDNEVSGAGNQYDYGFRIYNPRIGRFLSVDPLFKSYPELTPYQFASNTPIEAIDLDGLEAESSKKDGFWKSFGKSVLRGTSNTLKHIYNNPNHAGYGYSPNMKAPTQADFDRYKIDWRGVVDPKVWAEKFAENLVYGTTNFVGGIIDGDGGRTARAIPQLLSVVGTISGLKGFSGLKKTSLSLYEGNEIIGGALEDGVKIILASSADDVKYLQAMGAEALYMEGAGSSGSILLTKGASRSQILEEALHHQQRRLHGSDYFNTHLEELEVSAQDQLLRIGKREGWDQAELDQIQKAKEEWSKKLSDKQKKD